MIKPSRILYYIVISLFVFLSCEENSTSPITDENNPFKDKVGYNGLELKGKKYETPNAFVEIWSSSDTLSADYDGYLTDGTYDNHLNPPKIKDYSVIVYFDLNSPSLSTLATGTYLFENTNEKKPGIFNASSYIRIISNNKTDLYNVTSGTVTIDEQKGYILLEYELMVNKTLSVKGQYTGRIELKDPKIF